jgi:hypothetical protein
MGSKSAMIVAATLAVAATGCIQPRTADASGASAASVGTVLRAIVGVWKYDSGTFVFTQDGRYDVHYDYMQHDGPGRPDKHVVGDDRGTWTADDNRVYLRSEKGNVIRDNYKLTGKGSKMDLYAPFAKDPEILHRKSS